MIKNSLLIAAGLFLISLFSTTSEAGEFYLNLLGGANILSDSDLDIPLVDSVIEEIENATGDTLDASLKTTSDVGFLIGAGVGYDFGKYRALGEISYRKNKLDQLKADYTFNGVKESGRVNFSEGDTSV